MKRAVVLLAALLTAMSCATTSSPPGQSLVSRAVEAQGGAEALGRVKTLTEQGTVRHWEPEQSQVPGGEMRFAAESTFEATTDAATGATRIDWVRNFAYPSPRKFTFTEIVTADAGYVAGIDSNGRTKQSLESNPPAHSMSGLRLAATQRELRRGSPLLSLEMLRNPGHVTARDPVVVGGTSYPAVDYRSQGQMFTVLFDPATGLPARIRSLDYDNIWGDVTYDLVLSDWKVVDGVRVATSRKYELNGRTVADIKIADVKVNAPVDASRLAIPPAYRTAASKPASMNAPYQWVIRRQFIGTYLDSDVPSWDTRASTGLRLVEIAPGVQHVVGGSHHSLVVEMRDYLIVFDAPVSDAHSRLVIDAARAKYPNKPIEYLVLTHHHMDHAGGLRAYAAQGAALVVGKGAADHYRRVLAAPYARNPDLPSRDLRNTQIIEVADKHVFTDGREVAVYLVENNPHADGLVIGYVADARLGFVTDIWSPGAPLPDKLTAAQLALVATVKKAGISPARFAGGHGAPGGADYAPLAAKAAN